MVGTRLPDALIVLITFLLLLMMLAVSLLLCCFVIANHALDLHLGFRRQCKQIEIVFLVGYLLQERRYPHHLVLQEKVVIRIGVEIRTTITFCILLCFEPTHPRLQMGFECSFHQRPL
ncbi:hypothetical protein D3C73_1412990 [compost metagenome]